MKTAIIAFLTPAVLLVGCATPYDVEVIPAVSGDHQRVQQLATQAVSETSDLDASVHRLDVAMARLAGGDLEGAIEELDKGLQAIQNVWNENRENAGEKAWAEYAASFFLDGRQIAYEALDHERLVATALLAMLCEIAERPDAEGYLASAEERLVAVAQLRGGTDASTGEQEPITGLIEFFLGALREDGRRASLAAAADYYRRSLEREETAIAREASRRVAGEVAAAPGESYPVWVLLLEGPGYRRITVNEVLGVAAENAVRLVLELILNDGQIDNLKLPTMRFPLPQIERVESGIAGASVVLDGDDRPLELVTDLGPAIEADFARERQRQVILTAVRRAVKEALKQTGAKTVREIGDKQSWGGAWWYRWALTAVDVLFEASKLAESADTRCWSLMPERVRAVRLELPPGEHEVTLALHGDASAVKVGEEKVTPSGASSRSIRIEVLGDTTYVLGVAHSVGALGELVTNRPVAAAMAAAEAVPEGARP